MTTEAIIYSPSNIDSCLASAIMLMGFAKNSETVKTFPYSRGSNSFECPGPFKVIHILGADMTADDLLALFEANTDTIVYHVYNYDNSTVYPERMISKFSENHCFKIHSYEGFDGFKISVSSRVCSFIEEDPTKSLDYHDATMIKDYAGVVSLYMAFLPMSAAQTLFLFSNLSNVRKAAKGNQPMMLENGSSVVKSQQYDEYVQDVRHLVKANMSMAYYAGANGTGLRTPTICVGERDCMHAMRFIGYAHDEVISYEDTRSARIYRILSKENMQWYIKRFQPHDIWSEGYLTYLRTELPQHVR